MHIRESTVWLSSLNTMTSSSIHFLADDIVLFFMARSEALLCSSPFLYPSSGGGHEGWFYSLVVEEEGATDMDAQVSQ